MNWVYDQWRDEQMEKATKEYEEKLKEQKEKEEKKL
jgi:hypothetical protein